MLAPTDRPLIDLSHSRVGTWLSNKSFYCQTFYIFDLIIALNFEKIGGDDLICLQWNEPVSPSEDERTPSSRSEQLRVLFHCITLYTAAIYTNFASLTCQPSQKQRQKLIIISIHFFCIRGIFITKSLPANRSSTSPPPILLLLFTSV